MTTLHFTVMIAAPGEKVWQILWDEATYKKWTAVFSEGSHAISDWKEGSKITFLSAGGDGMYSVIARLIPNEFMSFKHIGVIKNNEEQPIDEETKKWSGSFENYTLKETNGNTELIVDMDVADEYLDYFNKTFPNSLQVVKELAEQ